MKQKSRSARRKLSKRPSTPAQKRAATPAAPGNPAKKRVGSARAQPGAAPTTGKASAKRGAPAGGGESGTSAGAPGAGAEAVLAPAGGGRRLTAAATLGERPYTSGGRPPASDLAGLAPVRLTAYLRPDQVLRLRAAAADRQARGQRADMSTLMREAVELLLPAAPTARRRAL